MREFNYTLLISYTSDREGCFDIDRGVIVLGFFLGLLARESRISLIAKVGRVQCLDAKLGLAMRARLLLLFQDESLCYNGLLSYFVIDFLNCILRECRFLELGKSAIELECPAFFTGVILLEKVAVCDTSQLSIWDTTFAFSANICKFGLLLLLFSLKDGFKSDFLAFLIDDMFHLANHFLIFLMGTIDILFEIEQLFLLGRSLAGLW